MRNSRWFLNLNGPKQKETKNAKPKKSPQRSRVHRSQLVLVISLRALKVSFGAHPLSLDYFCYEQQIHDMNDLPDTHDENKKIGLERCVNMIFKGY